MAEATLDQAPNRVLISSTRKPISYINICKKNLQEHGEVQLSALGVAISSLVTVAEILKNRGFAVEKKISTMLETREDKEDARSRQKPKLEVVLVKSEMFDELISAEAAEAAAKAEQAGDTA